MSSNMGLNYSSESEDFGTDKREWKNQQNLGTMQWKSKEVGGIKNDSLFSCLENWKMLIPFTKTETSERKIS